jgi:predicted RNA-binding Zn-ribbon protein involved in translation (DUF1610 family)
MKIVCPECNEQDSIKTIETCEKKTSFTIENGVFMFGEMHSEGEFTFVEYECDNCGKTWATSDELLEAIDLLPNTVSDVWGVDEVIERAEERELKFTVEEAKQVLLIMKENYDANVGMNWDYLDQCIDEWRARK